jgi:hypothetical protein
MLRHRREAFGPHGRGLPDDALLVQDGLFAGLPALIASALAPLRRGGQGADGIPRPGAYIIAALFRRGLLNVSNPLDPARLLAESGNPSFGGWLCGENGSQSEPKRANAAADCELPR